MINPSNLESIAKKIMESIPQDVGHVPDDIQKQIKATLSSSFAKMDLVTREEFDIQVAVLAKTRAKLEALEKQLEALERASQQTHTSD